MITETEAYGGEKDLASHARFGRTTRNAPMYKSGGRWYVYFTYGMHWLLNVISGQEGKPGGVLIRGVEGIKGPARVTKFFKIDKKFNDTPASLKTGLWIEARPDSAIKNVKCKIKNSPRIGVEYAGPVWSKKKWRFYLDNS